MTEPVHIRQEIGSSIGTGYRTSFRITSDLVAVLLLQQIILISADINIADIRELSLFKEIFRVRCGIEFFLWGKQTTNYWLSREQG